MVRSKMFGLVCLSAAELFSPPTASGQRGMIYQEFLVEYSRTGAYGERMIALVREDVEARRMAYRQGSTRAILDRIVTDDFIYQGYIIANHCERPASQTINKRLRLCRSYHEWQEEQKRALRFIYIGPK